MVAHPRLLIDSLHERVSERTAQDLRAGPEREMVSELRRLLELLRRVDRHLAKFHPPLAPELQGACQLVHASLPKVSTELNRLMP